jgi:MscS family membrane protein
MNESVFFERFENFSKTVKQVWENGVFGIDIGSIIAAFAIIVFFILFRKIIYKFIIKKIQNFTAKTDNKIDDEIINAIEKPLSYIPVIFGVYIAVEYLNPQGTAETIFKNLIHCSIVFVLFWAFYNLVEAFAWVLEKLESIFDKSLIHWLKKIIKGAFVFIGFAAVLEIWGIQIGPIIAGLGLFGVAVALGAQDLFKNLISGILILAEQRFAIGDWVRVEGIVEGTVESIGFRSTKIRRFDKAPVFVPNSRLSDNSVINFSEMTFRRISWMIALRYDTTIDQLKTIRNEIEAFLLENEDFVNPPLVPLFVRIDNFNNSSIDLMIYCFTKTTVWKEWLEIKEGLALEVKKIVENSGTDFAFPSQSVYIENCTEEPAVD